MPPSRVQRVRGDFVVLVQAHHVEELRPSLHLGRHASPWPREAWKSDALVRPAWSNSLSLTPSPSDRPTRQVALTRVSERARCHEDPQGPRLVRMPPQPLPAHRPTRQMDEVVTEGLPRSRPSPRPCPRRLASAAAAGMAGEVVVQHAGPAGAGMGFGRKARSHAPRGRARRAGSPRSLLAVQVQVQCPASQLVPRVAAPWLESRGCGAADAVAYERPQTLNHRPTRQMGRREERCAPLDCLAMVHFHFAAKLPQGRSGPQRLRQLEHRPTRQV